ncbi:MAG: rhomboid family intramembrane serine protease [Waddliaceae bacterium]
MRLIIHSNQTEEILKFSTFLRSQGIDNQVEVKVNNDWGSDNYGDRLTQLWIINEDQLDEANALYDEFKVNPNDSKYKTEEVRVNKLPPPPPPKQIETTENGTITFSIIFICTLLLILCNLTEETPPKDHANLQRSMIYACPVKKELLFDYPSSMETLQELTNTYDRKQLENPRLLPQAGRELYEQFERAPIWQGFYSKLIQAFRGEPNALQVHATLFEKIREGEIWRLFTPAILHSGIFHLFFNMIWLLVIGRQMEAKIRSVRYILFILAAAVFSNVCQYLMSGPNFLGFSGVVCAMIVFVWFRQQKAPWEGYQLLPSTMGFITLFVLGMALLQLISFATETFYNFQFAPGIANTAHLSGALFGYVCSKIKFFTAR